MVSKRLKKQRGASLVEYSILIGLISLTCIPAIQALQHGINKSFCGIMLEKSSQELSDSEYTADGHCVNVTGGSSTQLF